LKGGGKGKKKQNSYGGGGEKKRGGSMLTGDVGKQKGEETGWDKSGQKKAWQKGGQPGTPIGVKGERNKKQAKKHPRPKKVQEKTRGTLGPIRQTGGRQNVFRACNARKKRKKKLGKKGGKKQKKVTRGNLG